MRAASPFEEPATAGHGGESSLADREARPLILHVIHHFVTGGMENGLVSLINNMPSSQFRHTIVCIEDYSDFRERLTRKDTEVVALHRSRIGAWRMRYRLFKMFRRLKPAIVHSRNQSGLDALLPARLAGVPHCVHGEHGWDVHDLDGRSVKEMVLRRIHSPLVGCYVTVSQSLRDYLVKRVGVRPNRITTICNGVDTEKFHPGTGKPFDLMPAGFADDATIVIGTIGRLQPVKDQETLIRAFAELVREDPVAARVARLVVVGDGPLAETLRELARELDVAHLAWFPGDRRDVAPLFRVIDVFVLPSLAEGISNTILEAMATALPVIATRVGGNVELVQDGVNGRLFDAGDRPSLKRLLADYLGDPAMRRRHGEASRAMASEKFSLEKMVKTYQGTYESLIAGADATLTRP